MADLDTKKRLGRGLSALLGDAPVPPGAPMPAAAPAERGGVQRIPVASLRRNPNNPRATFSDDALDELAASLARHGVIEPLVVRPAGDGFEIIAGERRWRAAQRAKLHEVPVVVREATDGEALELAIIENVQRADLNAIEEARGYQRLIDEFGHRQEDLAKLIGKSRPHVTNTLRLLALPPSIQASVAEGDLSAGHARALIGVDDAEAVADEVIRRGLSVRATEALVAGRSAPAAPRSGPVVDPNIRAVAKQLSDFLGLKVALAHNGDESGTMTIRYSSLEQLEHVCGLLTKR